MRNWGARGKFAVGPRFGSARRLENISQISTHIIRRFISALVAHSIDWEWEAFHDLNVCRAAFRPS